MKHCRACICIVLFSLLVPFFGYGQNARGDALRAALPGEELTLKVAVIGTGDELYFWWGHLGLIIENSLDGSSRFYDYGIFSFENDNFFANFALGRLLYTCGVSDSALNINYYIRTNRDITLYTLDLPPEARLAVFNFAQWNVQPENKDYYYHHFRDNCATRIRDILDMAVQGQFKESYGVAPGRYTLRQHVRRHTWFSPLIDWALNFWMGRGIDTPISVWDEMFLPSEIGKRIEEFNYTDASGLKRKLVTDIEIISRAENRPVVLDEAPRSWTGAFILGAAIALALFVSSKLPRGRALFGTLQALIGLFFGLAGTVLLFMILFTNHDYTYHNINILFANPLLLAALPLGFSLAFGKKPEQRERAAKFLGLLFSWVSAACLFTILVRVFPGYHQQNQNVQALVLPFSLVLSCFPRWGRRLARQAARLLGRILHKG
ncbi:MAG: DUF4105 domain-containing protein [Spirochaetaceae bacterium]|nr:DUF4105 domain-containing protein [Spirochaetaceae bacterium]